MKYRKRCLLRSNKPIIETLTNKVVYYPTKNKTAASEYTYKCAQLRLFCVDIISSCKRVAALVLPVARIVLHISFLNNLCLF